MKYDAENYGEGNIDEFYKGIDVLEYILNYHKDDLNKKEILYITSTIDILSRFMKQYAEDL